MRSLIDFEEPDAWEVIQAFEKIENGYFIKHILLVPTQTVAGIPKERVRFLIEISVPSIGDLENPREKNDDFKNIYIHYTFVGFFNLGGEGDFLGEYTFRFEINAISHELFISPAADFSISAFEVNHALELARALSWTLPRNMIRYGAIHDTDFVIDKWREATFDDVSIYRPRLL
jgi:hypothetical protein